MTELSTLFSSIKIGNCEIRNRILISGHLTNFGENGLPSERHLKYYEARAKGGAGLICMEAIPVSPHGYILPTCVKGWNDDIIPGLKKISNAVHAHGAKIFCQAWHNGAQNSSYHSQVTAQSCSAIPSAAIGGEVPDPMTEKDIKEAIQQYVSFSLRLKQGGFDGVELHFGHGYLPQQFLSPYSNNRQDKYGGSLENRSRFGLELIDAVRTAVGSDFVVGLRISADELVPGGLILDDMVEIASIFEKTGQIDYLNVTVAIYKSAAAAIPPMAIPPTPFVYTAAEIRQAVEIPVFAAIRINDPITADDIIKNGEADMVVMTRATICDPEMPNKAKEGRLDDIRQCIACNEGCWERSAQHLPITCAQNPLTGKEGVLQIEPASKPKKIMVVGGGIGGMAAAAIAKERGHDVTLYERSSELGGALLIASKPHPRGELEQAVRFRKHELVRLGIDVRLNTDVTALLVKQENPDAVIVATGAETIDNPSLENVGMEFAIEIEQGAHVVTAEDILEGKAEAGQKVVIADQQNYIKGLVTAEILADEEKDVTVVTPLPIRILNMNPYDMDGPTLGVHIVNITHKGVERISDYAVRKALPGKVVIQNHFTEEEVELDADTLVLSYWRKANIDFFHEIDGMIDEVYRIGDCMSPRRYIDAVREGYDVGLRI